MQIVMKQAEKMCGYVYQQEPWSDRAAEDQEMYTID
jgi:hypothetical protein